MTEQQERLVPMLAWFHNFCETHGLRYYIIAGTMLGAVRHGGFIPWDDDIDVGMPRSDYERLKTIAREFPSDIYRFEYPGENKDYPHLMAKLYDTRTTFVEKKRHLLKRGIYLDIFPLDGVGNTWEEATTHYKPFSKRFKLHLTITCAFLKRRSLKKNLAVLFGRVVSPLFVKKAKLEKKIDEICRRYDFDESAYVSNLIGGSGHKGIVLREYFGKPTLITFEGIEVYGLENPDAYLTAMYGAYMELPPEEKRVSLHDSEEVDLSKSYLDEA